MKIRYKKNGIIAHSNKLNFYSIREILVGEDSVSIYELEVELHDENGNPYWKNMNEAFLQKDIIVSNTNLHFRESLNMAERAKGYYD